MNNLDIRCNTTEWRSGVEIRARANNGGGYAYMEPVVFSDGAEGDYLPPAMVIDMDSAQRLMDELWGCGLRPTDGSGSAGAMAATQKHLEDMRSLVFEKG